MNRTEQVVKQQFQEYYTTAKKQFYAPPRPEEREYGFLLFKEKFMVRHRGFKDPDALLGAIRDLVPAHVYFSTARYQEPTASMQEKGWKSADLVFDIDADHLDTPCKKEHDSWKCKACVATGKGTAPKLCPKCKSDRFDDQTWLCEKCLHQAKEETSKLLEILHSDFGISPSETRLFFSGHRGYHVHVYSEELCKIEEEGRREIADYVLGLGLEPTLHELSESSVDGIKVLDGPQLGQPGWRGRIVSGMYDILTDGDAAQLGLSQTQTTALKAFDRDGLLKQSFWNSVKGLGLGTWKTLSLKAVEKRSAKIDTVVTTDVHRLIRLPGTLNGHTGLLAMNVSEENFDDFNPFTESVAFHGSMRVLVKDAPEFNLGGKQFGPYHNEKVDLSLCAAILLLCKHRAEPLN